MPVCGVTVSASSRVFPLPPGAPPVGRRLWLSLLYTQHIRARLFDELRTEVPLQARVTSLEVYCSNRPGTCRFGIGRCSPAAFQSLTPDSTAGPAAGTTLEVSSVPHSSGLRCQWEHRARAGGAALVIAHSWCRDDPRFFGSGTAGRTRTVLSFCSSTSTWAE